MKHCDKLIKQTVDQTVDQPVVLPEGKLGDEYRCCSYCNHAEDYKDGYLIFSDKVQCEIDGKWHDAKYVCKYFEEL